MSNTPSDLKYTNSHEWIREEGDGHVVMGITQHAQELLGDLVYVELPDEGAEFQAGDECAVVESVKAASDVYTPLSGEVTEINTELESEPALINRDPYGSGWLFRLKATELSEFDALLTAEEYEKQIETDDD